MEYSDHKYQYKERPMAEPLYRGFSSVANRGIETGLFDLDLIKQDLLNHFNTRIGERVARPTFGSIIWDLLFDPGDPRTESLVIQDAQRIIGMEPRVRLLELVPFISLDSHEISLNIRIQSVQYDMDDWFNVTFRTSLG
jgi:phage baseplate assembly protein W